MTYRKAAEVAQILGSSEDPALVALALKICLDLADRDCYLAKLNLAYWYERGAAGIPVNLEKASLWAENAKSMHIRLQDPSDLFDAGMRCMWDELFKGTRDEALVLWLRGAEVGGGEALYAYCDATRNSQDRPDDWGDKLEKAARLGSVQAMIEHSEQEGIRGTREELIWLQAASSLGSLRAREIVQTMAH